MNQVYDQSKNQRIIVISFLSLSPISQSSSNVFELFASFKAANALTQCNLSLIQAVQNCILVGHIDPHVIMLGGSENYLQIIKLSWMKQILKSPLGFTIQYLGELCNFLVSKTPQCSTVELEEAVCKCVCELVNTGLPSNLKYIIRHVTKFLPIAGDISINDHEHLLSADMIKSVIDGLQQKGLVYNTGHGYNVMTADKLRVAKWLDELPDSRMSVSCSANDEKRTVAIGQKSANRMFSNGEHSENTDDCLSCHDLRGVKYCGQSSAEQKPTIRDNRRLDVYVANCLDIDNYTRDTQMVSTDDSLNKSRMLCSNVSKKDMSKRPSCSKYDSNFISRIICGMKKLRVHWPLKNGVLRSSNIRVPEVYHQTNFNTDANVINSRLSQSMYAFNQLNDNYQPDNDIAPPIVSAATTTTEHFYPYGQTKSISPVNRAACYGINYAHNDMDHSFLLMEDQRCCSELMLTARSSILTPNLYPMIPLQHCNDPITKPDHKMVNNHTAPSSANHCYFSAFTCDSGFNSVRGITGPDNDASQSKTSSPPDMNNSKKSVQYNCSGPCAWQVTSLSNSVYQSATLAPVIESSRYTK